MGEEKEGVAVLGQIKATKPKANDWPIVIGALIFVFIALLSSYNLNYTGLVTYETLRYEKIWSFDDTNYNYDSNLIKISNGEAKLVATTTSTEIVERLETKLDLTSAFLEDKDKLDKLVVKDGETVNTHNKLLQITFGSQLTEDDVISLYLTDGDGIINLYNEGCVNSFQYTSTGFYNVSLLCPITALNISGNSKIDLIYAIHFDENRYTITNTTYPAEASLETQSLEMLDSILEAFNANSALNGQEIVYNYNDGQSWKAIAPNATVNTTDFRVKATLKSNSTATPVLYDMTLTYLIQRCIPEWNCTSWSPCTNFVSSRSCEDMSCGGQKQEQAKCAPDYYEIGLNTTAQISIEQNKTTTINSSYVVVKLIINQEVNTTFSIFELDEEGFLNVFNITIPNVNQYLTAGELLFYYNGFNYGTDNLTVKHKVSDWIILPTIVDTQSKIISANTPSFSLFGIANLDFSMNETNTTQPGANQTENITEPGNQTNNQTSTNTTIPTNTTNATSPGSGEESGSEQSLINMPSQPTEQTPQTEQSQTEPQTESQPEQLQTQTSEGQAISGAASLGFIGNLISNIKSKKLAQTLILPIVIASLLVLKVIRLKLKRDKKFKYSHKKTDEFGIMKEPEELLKVNKQENKIKDQIPTSTSSSRDKMTQPRY